MAYMYLFIAIVSEVIATNLLKATNGFTKLFPTVSCLVLYFDCFYALSKAIKFMPLGVAYAVWGAVGVIFITLFSVFYWKESVNLPTIIGLSLIINGTILVNIYGGSHS